jgi:putative transcription factor
MECEICGRETSKAKMIIVDGSSLIACKACASFGKEKPMPAGMDGSLPGGAESKFEGERARRVPVKRVFFEPMKQEFDLGLEIVPDFGKRVMQARQKKGLTAKELALKVFEKESLLHRIENQAIKPSDSLIKKLEKELGIELREKAETE